MDQEDGETKYWMKKKEQAAAPAPPTA